MITSAEQLLLDMVRAQLLGVQLPSNLYGQAGNHIEQLLKQMGIPVNKHSLIDIRTQGIKLEVKSRKDDASSAFTIGTVTQNNIIKTTDWFKSPICKKMHKIILFTTSGTESDPNDNIITDITIYDFKSRPEIQDLLAEAYTNSRDQLLANNKNKYFKYCNSSGYIAYFERVPETNSWKFRFNNGRYQSLLRMGKSTFNQIFEYNV